MATADNDVRRLQMNKGGWVLIVLGGLLMGVGAWMLGTAYASTTWPVMEGRVLESKVASRFFQSSDSVRRRLEYYIAVTYAYDVAGQEYQASRYSLGTGNTFQDGFNDRAEAKAWLQQSPYQINSPIQIHVSPGDPTNTVISAGIRFSTWIPVLLGLLFIGFGWMVKWLAVQAQNRPSNPSART